MLACIRSVGSTARGHMAMEQIVDSGSFKDIQHDDESIMDKVFVRENIDIESLVELTYYSVKYPPVCLDCGITDCTEGAVNYPMYDGCVNWHKNN